MKLKVNQASCVKGLIWFISLFLGFTNFLLYGIAIRGLLFHKGDPIILQCAIEGTMTLAALTVIQLFYRQNKPILDRLEKYENDRLNALPKPSKATNNSFSSIEEAKEKLKDFEGNFVHFSVAELNTGQYGQYRLSRDREKNIVVNTDGAVTVYSITLARRLAVEELGERELQKILTS